MKVYLAKDWRGLHVFGEEPHLLENLPAFPPTWSGYELKCFKLAEDYNKIIPEKQFIIRSVWWSMVNMI